MHAPALVNQLEVIPPAVQEELQTLKHELQRLVGDKPSCIDQEIRKGTHFSPRVAAAEIQSKFKRPVLQNYNENEDPVSHVNKFEIQMDIQKVSKDA